MTVLELVRSLRTQGVRLRTDGERLVIQAPPGAITIELETALRTHKEALLSLLQESTPRAASEPVDRGRPSASEGPPVLSRAQERFWQLQRLTPESTVYNLPGAFRLTGPLDVPLLHGALQRIVDRHDILRSSFREEAGETRVSIAKDLPVLIHQTDLRHVPEDQLEARMKEFLETTADEPLDLESGPPFRIHLARVGGETHALLFVAHSIVWDGWSFDMLLSEMTAHYGAAVEGRSDSLAPLPVQYPQFARWQSDQLERGLLDAQLDYWGEKLKGGPPSLAVPKDRPGTVASSYEGARVTYRFEGEILDGIRELARSEGATPYMVLLTALDVLLYRYSGVRDLMISTPLQCRTHPDVEDLIGVFVNTLFLKNQIDPGMSFRTLLREVRDTCLEAVDNQEAPSDLVIQRMEESGLNRVPHEVIFIFQQTAARPEIMGPVQVGSIMRGTRKVAVDLVVWAREYEGYVDGGFDYRTALFDRGRVEGMVAHFEGLVRAALESPDGVVGSMPMLGKVETDELRLWGQKRSPRSGRRASLAIAPIEMWVGSSHRSAQETEEAFVRLRRRIADASGPSNTPKPVALIVDGSVESTLALAVLADSGQDVVLLPEGLPVDLLNQLLEESGTGVLVAHETHIDERTSVPTMVLGPDKPDEATPIDGTAEVRRSPRGDVLFLTTSSGGERTLVRRSWDSLVEDVEVVIEKLELSDTRGIAVCGDSVPEQVVTGLLAAFYTSAPLALNEYGVPPDGYGLNDWIHQGRIGAVLAGSRALQDLVDTGWSSSVSAVLTGDPFLSGVLESKVRELSDRYMRGWGVAEIGSWLLLGGEEREDTSLGRPTVTGTVRVLDEQGEPVPQGVPGELVVGRRGSDVASNGPNRDATPRFIEDPLKPGSLLFRTRERAMWGKSGELIYLGPLASEVTLHGFRIDSIKVSRVLRSHRHIRDAYVAVRPVDGERHLIAYVLLDSDDPLLVSEVRKDLRQQIPPWEIPSRVIQVDEILRSPQGVVFEEFLPTLSDGEVSHRFVAPRSPEEISIAEAWIEALDLTRVSVNDNFFELGGHSLLAVQLTAKLDSAFGLRIDPRALFFNTLEQVATAAVRCAVPAGVAGDT